MDICFVKNNVIAEIIVCDLVFAEQYKSLKGYNSYHERTNENLGYIYDAETENYIVQTD